MPLYEYHCEKCDAIVEVLIRGSAQHPECPECGSRKLEKQMSVVASPAVAGGDLPVSSPDAATCGRPQCQSGCMFD